LIRKSSIISSCRVLIAEGMIKWFFVLAWKLSSLDKHTRPRWLWRGESWFVHRLECVKRPFSGEVKVDERVFRRDIRWFLCIYFQGLSWDSSMGWLEIIRRISRFLFLGIKLKELTIWRGKGGYFHDWIWMWGIIGFQKMLKRLHWVFLL